MNSKSRVPKRSKKTKLVVDLSAKRTAAVRGGADNLQVDANSQSSKLKIQSSEKQPVAASKP